MTLLVAVCALASCKLSCLAPQAELIDASIAATLQTAKTDGASFDHSVFDDLVRVHAQPSGRVDYAELQKSEGKLDAYLDQLADVRIDSLSRDAQKALLINAYNAFTLKLILEHYPAIESIKDLPSPWKQTRWKLANETLSLDDIEHGLLRPIYGDARIHFAVNCASIGCPPLAAFAYTGDGLDQQLDEVTRKTLNNARYARVVGDVLWVTPLMNWYGPDFGEVPAFTREYRDDVPQNATVKFLDYDWSLNDVSD